MNAHAKIDSEKVEVTPEMIEAGAPYLLRFRVDRHNEEDALAKIYRAMAAASPNVRDAR